MPVLLVIVVVGVVAVAVAGARDMDASRVPVNVVGSAGGGHMRSKSSSS